MMRPHLAFFIAGTICWARKNGALRLISKVSFQVFVETSSACMRGFNPAAFINMSTSPNWDVIFFETSSNDSISPRSAETKPTLPSVVSAHFDKASTLRATAITLAPLLAK